MWNYLYTVRYNYKDELHFFQVNLFKLSWFSVCGNVKKYDLDADYEKAVFLVSLHDALQTEIICKGGEKKTLLETSLLA